MKHALYSVPPAPRTGSPVAQKLILSFSGIERFMLMFGSIFLAVGSIFVVIFCWGVLDTLNHFKVGDEVTVLYDRSNPKSCTLFLQ